MALVIALEMLTRSGQGQRMALASPGLAGGEDAEMTQAATYSPWSYGSRARDEAGQRRARIPAARGTGSLFGREAELAAVAAGAGSLVFVEGHAGIGKTSLLEAARARARADGVRVLWGCGQELERGFGFGVVRQLFERVVSEAPPDDRGRLLAGPAALASAAVGVEPAADRGGHAPDSPFPIVHALYLLTTNLAEREGLVLFVDDAHWADALSLRFLDYLAARLQGVRVGVVVAARPAEPEERESRLLAGLRPRARSGLVRLGPLGFEEAGALVSVRFGDVPDRALVAACVRATGGNPFLLGELVDALLVDGVVPDAGAAGLVAGLGPETVARSLMLRLGRLPAVTGPVVDAVAVLDAHAETRHVAAVCGLSLQKVGSAADALARANVLAGGRPLRFVHPIVRQAVYGALGSGLRSQLHALAAEVLMADEAPPERVAAHLLLCEPAADSRVVAVLRAAAAAALCQGSADLAQRLLGRALAEPPPAGQVADTLGDLGAAEALAVGSSHWRASISSGLRPAPLIRRCAVSGCGWRNAHACTRAISPGRPRCCAASARRSRRPSVRWRCGCWPTRRGSRYWRRRSPARRSISSSSTPGLPVMIRRSLPCWPSWRPSDGCRGASVRLSSSPSAPLPAGGCCRRRDRRRWRSTTRSRC